MLKRCWTRASQIINEESQKFDRTKKGDYSTMDRLRLQSEKGFTLIELLVVIAIIGILAAIAIPQFAAYRKRGYEATLKSDLRNAATAQEAYFAQVQTYKNGTITTNLTGYNQSGQVTMASAVSGTAFTLTGTHANCTSGVTWTYSSSTGQTTGASC
jgi:type IV pilus assembly protein PilA